MYQFNYGGTFYKVDWHLTYGSENVMQTIVRENRPINYIYGIK
jgi:hypothetical protein